MLESSQLRALALLGAGSLIAVGCETTSPPPTATPAPVQAVGPAAPVLIQVSGIDFEPNEVTLPTDRRVTFRRISNDTCATAVVFPDVDIEIA